MKDSQEIQENKNSTGKKMLKNTKTLTKIAIGVGALLVVGAAVAVPTSIVVTNNKAEYSVTVDDGVGQDEVVKVKKGSVIGLLEIPVKEGYSFGGWYTSPDFKPETKLALNTIITKNIKVYALMIKNQIKVTCSVDGVVKNISLDSDATVADLTTAVNPQKDSYKFVGWCSDSELLYAVDNAATVSSSTIYYAKFEKLTLTVVYSIDGVTKNVAMGENSTVADLTQTVKPQKDLYTFVGWYSDEELETPVQDTALLSTTTTYYAKFEKQTVSITYVVDGVVKNVTIDIDATVADLTAEVQPSKELYDFMGWYSDGKYTTPVSDADTLSTTTCYYAKFERQTLQVNYSIEGVAAQVAIDTNSTVADLTAKVKPQKALYNFVGWYSDEELETPVQNTDTLSTTTTYYAKFEKQTANISCYVDGVVKIVTVDVDATVADLTTEVKPNKEFYEFSGWYSDNTLTTPVADADTLSTTTCYYAKFEKIVRQISYSINGVESTLNFDADQKVSDLTTATNPTPTNAAYEFTGWYSDEDFNDPVNNDAYLSHTVTYYARFEKIMVQASYSIDGVVTPLTIDIDATVADLTTKVKPQKALHTFVGWCSDEGLETLVENTDTISTTITYYAKFEEFSLVLTGRDGTVINKIARSTLLAEATDGLYTIPTQTTETEYFDEALDRTVYFQGWVKESEYDDLNPTLILPYDEFDPTTITEGHVVLKAYFGDDDDWYEDINLTYSTYKDTYTIYSFITERTGEITIPPLYKGKLITSLSSSSTSFCHWVFTNITKLILPRSVTQFEITTCQAENTTLVLSKNVKYVSVSLHRHYESGFKEIIIPKGSNLTAEDIKLGRISGDAPDHNTRIFDENTNKEYFRKGNFLYEVIDADNYRGLRLYDYVYNNTLPEQFTSLSKDFFSEKYSSSTLTIPDSITTLEIEEGFYVPEDVTIISTNIDFSQYPKRNNAGVVYQIVDENNWRGISFYGNWTSSTLSTKITSLSKDFFANTPKDKNYTIIINDSVTTLDIEDGFWIPENVTIQSTNIDFSQYPNAPQVTPAE